MRTVAALYIDPRGPYPSMPGVECWDEQRDARGYPGPHPVVAHPPCGPWGTLARFCTKQPADLAPLAVNQVRRWGGVLEHPRGSRLWSHCSLPLPGELPDAFGGRTAEVDQVSWGHRARKSTWLYVVTDVVGPIHLLRGGVPTHTVTRFAHNKGDKQLLALSRIGRRLTPPAFAEFLVGIARSCRRTEAA